MSDLIEMFGAFFTGWVLFCTGMWAVSDQYELGEYVGYSSIGSLIFLGLALGLYHA